MRQAASSSTTLTSRGSAKSATGGSLKARCPFSPMPRQHRSSGWLRSRSAVAAALGLGVAQPLQVVGRSRVGRARRCARGSSAGSRRDGRAPRRRTRPCGRPPCRAQGTPAVSSTSACTKASWEFPVANITWALPRASTAARMTSSASSAAARAIAASVGVDSHGRAVDAPGPCPHGAQHARRRLGQTGPVRDVVPPGPAQHGGGVEGGAPLPRRDAGGRRPAAGADRVGQGRDGPAHGLVQGARWPGGGVGHAGGGARPCRRGVVRRQSRARPRLRGVEARRPGHRRRADGSLGGQGLGACNSSTCAWFCTARAIATPRRTRSSWLPATGAATCRPTTTPT